MLQKLPACKAPSHRSQFLSTRKKLQLLLGTLLQESKIPGPSADSQQKAGRAALPSWLTPTLKTASITCSHAHRQMESFALGWGFNLYPPPPPPNHLGSRNLS